MHGFLTAIIGAILIVGLVGTKDGQEARLAAETERARETASLLAHARGTVPPAMVWKSQICLVMETSKTPYGPWTPQGTENCDTSYTRLRAR